MNTLKLTGICILVALFFSCEGQNSKNKQKGKAETLRQSITPADTASNKPKVSVNVNRKYDKNGKLLQFDSTYSYVYSSPHGIKQLDNDSVFNQFQSFMNKQHPNFFENQNNAIFFNDSLFKYDFFNDDYFQKRFQLNQKNFENFYKEMDSLKQNFLHYQYPQGYQKKTK